jgi:hypothetical protein
MTTEDKADLLEELIGYEGCELGGFWGDLINMYRYSKDYMSEEFWLQMGLELEIQFEDAVNFVMEGEIDVEDEDLMKRITDYLKE